MVAVEPPVGFCRDAALVGPLRAAAGNGAEVSADLVRALAPGCGVRWGELDRRFLGVVGLYGVSQQDVVKNTG